MKSSCYSTIYWTNTDTASVYPTTLKKKITGKCQVGKGISDQASHGTVRESLDSYGSCYSNHYLFKTKLPMCK